MHASAADDSRPHHIILFSDPSHTDQTSQHTKDILAYSTYLLDQKMPFFSVDYWANLAFFLQKVREKEELNHTLSYL